jgi:Sulfatase
LAFSPHENLNLAGLNSIAAPRASLLRALALGQLFALLFLGACILWMYRDLQLVIGSNTITVAEAWAQARQSILPWRVAGFALAVMGVHALLGLLAWGLAHLTRVALGPRAGPSTAALTVAWAFLITLLTLAANAAWFPASRFSYDGWMREGWLGFAPAHWLLVVSVLSLVAIGLPCLVRLSHHEARRLGRVVIAVMVVAGVVALPALRLGDPQAKVSAGPPNVVLIGVDSMRDDLTEVAEGRRITPRIDAFLRDGYRFRDALTPLARTFPAWVSILTGRHPVSTNARFNLMPRRLVHEGDTLPEALRARGYHAVYATDEVRFANIDQSFGFDQLITPPMGASDFLLAELGDLPLVNLIAATPIGRGLFPTNHANRASSVTYRPAQFVARLDRELDLDGPSLLAIHLTLAHWPYTWAEQAKPTTPQTWRPAYRDSLEAVDRQFQEVLDLLQRKGVLENAFVVVLSDHGDALGYPSDSMLRKTGSSREIWDSLWGHGTSVMSPHQYGVLLGIRAFGHAKIPGSPRALAWPVSLEDLRPTLEELVTGKAPRHVDGISLVPYFEHPGRHSELESRVRYTETCFNTVKLMQGNITASGVAREAAPFFEIDARSGWVQLRPDRLPEIMRKKQRAAISRDSMLAMVPSWTDDSVIYLFTGRRSPLPVRLEAPPDPRTDPEAARLWEALENRFPGEIPAPTALP